jgi:hypothetical protein
MSMHRHFPNFLAGNENYLFTRDNVVRLDFNLFFRVHSSKFGKRREYNAKRKYFMEMSA